MNDEEKNVNNVENVNTVEKTVKTEPEKKGEKQQPEKAKRGVVRALGEKLVAASDKHDAKKAARQEKKAAKSADGKKLTKGQKLAIGGAVAVALAGGGLAMLGRNSKTYELSGGEYSEANAELPPVQDVNMDVSPITEDMME